MVARAILVLVVLNLFIFGAASGFHRTRDSGSEVERRVHALDLTQNERNWERIGWMTDMEHAVTLARQAGRPIFVLAAEGNLDGRC